MRLSTKLVLVTLGLVIVPLVLLTASLLLLRVYRPRALRTDYGQEDTNIMNINVIRRFDARMNQLRQEITEREPETLLDPQQLSELNEDFLKDKAYLLGYLEECYFNGDAAGDCGPGIRPAGTKRRGEAPGNAGQAHAESGGEQNR